jgi:glutaconate CoA-transferase subunit B
VTVDDVRTKTGWELKVAADLAVTEAPTDEELSVLRDLKSRTEAAHSS